MADSIGGINCFRIDGNVQGYGYDLEDVSRPHENGVALRRTGKKSPEVRLQAIIDVSAQTDVKAMEDTTLPNIKGTLVTLIQGGVSRSNIAVLDFQIESVDFFAVMIGSPTITDGNSGYRMRVDFRVRYAGVPS